MTNLKSVPDFEEKAALELMEELEKGKKSGEEKEWLSSKDVKAHFMVEGGGELTKEQLAEIEEAKKQPIVFDEDCPKGRIPYCR